jgi:SulP family sulfate permease
MRRMSEETNVVAITREFRDVMEDPPMELDALEIPAGVTVYEIQGPFFFGASESFREALGQTKGRPKALILWMREVPAIDSTGLQRLRETWKRASREGILLLLADLRSQPLAALRRAGLLEEIGEDRVVGSLEEALDIAALATTGSHWTGGTPARGIASQERPT